MNGTKHTGNSHTPGVSQSRTLPPRERGWAGLTDDPLVKQRREEINEQWREEHPLSKLGPTEEAAFTARSACLLCSVLLEPLVIHRALFAHVSLRFGTVSLARLLLTVFAHCVCSLAMERRVLASDQQSWAYLSLQRMAAERDLVATAPEHFLHIAAKHAKDEANNQPSMGNCKYTRNSSVACGLKRPSLTEMHMVADTLGGVAPPARSEEGQQRSRGTRVSIQEDQNKYSEPEPELAQ